MLKPSALMLALSVAVLSGCSFTPDYVRPDAPVAAQWPDASPAHAGRDARQLAWQAYFPDPRLQALIASALEHNRGHSGP